MRITLTIWIIQVIIKCLWYVQMTQRYHVLGLAYLALLTSSSLVLPALALPSAPPGSNRQARVSPVYQHGTHYPEPLPYESQDVRKYAEKPNASKKVVSDADLDLQNNSVQVCTLYLGLG